MPKKIFYFILILTFNFLFNQQNIEAKEYCHIYQNDSLYETIEIPFYFHSIIREQFIEGANLPTIKYSKNTDYITSLTQCELIKKNVTYDFGNISFSEVITFSKNDFNYIDEKTFYTAIFKNNGDIIRGFAREYDEEPPVIQGYLTQYTSNIDYPLNLESLKRNFSAYDEFDGNITNKIKIEYDEYTNNTNKLGNYLVIISVEDSSLNKTTISFHIEIIDNTPPIINGKKNYTSFFSSPINTEEIKNSLTASDNVDGDLSSQIFICDDLYSQNKTTIGIHNVFYCVYDSSDNLSNSFKVSIEVKDDIPPIIEGLDTFTSYLSNPLTIKEIMYSLAASDNGQDISNSIFVTNDLYSNYQSKPGKKTIYFQAMDKHNNLSSPFIVTIDLIDDIAPQIYGLNLFDSYLSSPISLTYIKQQLTVLDNIDGNISSNLDILSDSYSNNINNRGSFHISFQAKDSSSNISQEFKVTINNIDNVSPYFIGPDVLTYELTNKPSLEAILNQYSTKDNIDQNIDFEIIEDTYSPSIETGTFFIRLSCKDFSNNESAPFVVKIEVVEKLIKLNEITLLLPTSKLFATEEINALINLNSNYTVIENTYTPNYSTIGSYIIKYELEDKSILSITINTFIEKKQTQLINNQTKKETFISKIKRFFKNIFIKIKTFLKKLFF